MTNFLIRKFVKNSGDVQNPAVRSAYGKISSIVGIFCNVLLFTGKLIGGLISGSVSITADAVNNLSDASSSIISLLGFKLASRPADEEHPYGHGRYEYLSGLMVALLIMVIGVELLKSSIGKIIEPTAVEFSWFSITFLVISVVIKLWMMLFNLSVGKKINSKTLIATAADSRNDVISTTAVIIAALISHFTNLELDGWIGTAVAVFILYSGFELIKDTLDPLLGKAPDEKQVEEMKQKILSYPGILGTHDLMIHDYGPGRQFASVHVEMAAEKDVTESHDVIDEIERDFKKNDGIHMLVHLDPINTETDESNDFRIWLSEKVKEINNCITIHDLRMIHGKLKTKVLFDCVVPKDINGEDVIKRINEIVTEKYPDYYCGITVDRGYAAMPH